MASVERRDRDGNTTWRVVWRQPVNGRRTKQQITFPDPEQAHRFRLLVEAHANTWPPGWEPARPGPTTDLTFGQWAKQAIDTRTLANPRTRHDYHRNIDHHFTQLTPRPLNDITAADITAWLTTLTDRRGQPLGPTSRQRLCVLGRSIYAAALAHTPPLADHNPFPARLTKTPGIRTEEMTFLTPQEFDLLLRHIHPDMQALFRFLAGTGMRYGEATALLVNDVDLLGRRKTVTVTKTWKRLDTTTWVVGEPKTPRSRRTLSLSAELVDLLTPLWAGRSGGDLLFTNRNGHRVDHSSVWHNVWAPAVACARVCDTHRAQQLTSRGHPKRRPDPCDCDGVLRKRPRIHDLRHSHVSWLIAEGLDLTAISRRLGHSSIVMTVDRYGHMDPAGDVAMDAAVDRALAHSRSD